jgi:hypothetical protein
MKRNEHSIFFWIKFYGLEVASTVIFCAALYALVRYEVTHLLAK